MNDSTAKGVVLLAALTVMFTLTVYVCSVLHATKMGYIGEYRILSKIKLIKTIIYIYKWPPPGGPIFLHMAMF